MNLDELFNLIEEFTRETHGSTNYDKDTHFVEGKDKAFAPLSFLVKKLDSISGESDLIKAGLHCDSYDMVSIPNFGTWFKKQFGRKLTSGSAKSILVLRMPDRKKIFEAVSQINSSFEVLRNNQILINNKNIPVQIGEWYVKGIFGLKQIKSTSQRGFDFYLNENRVEVKVFWGDISSPKGVKIRKSLLNLSKHCVIIYLSKNFMIREVCFLDTNFVLRKLSGKGHTVFLKDSDIQSYFFSRSTKHFDKIVNKTSLMQFANPTFAMRLDERFKERVD
jgi:hypothetical protein